MRTAIVIPARYASTRFPGKPLVALRGASGIAKSLVRRSWEAALRVPGIDRAVVATDDARIRAEAEGFGAEVLMTSEDCRNGTERCAEALDGLGEGYGIVVNLQGDAPLTPPWFIEALVAAMRARPEVQVATPVLRCDLPALQGFLADRRAGRVGGTTAVFDAQGDALYFSKEVIPFTGRELGADEVIPVFHHAGVYAYRAEALRAYAGWPMGPLESWEGLEQLRFLEQGVKVACIEVEARGARFWELNNPVDVARIEAILAEEGQE
ncbi:MAG TPA: manno-octulosonate cytidylyltransferase [Paracoccaceae bacterium]|nr:manno-octulosonate cytidylyltransferase [Paracoccaceae bacterium]